MISLARGQVSSVTTPALMFISQNVGQAVPAASLSWRILDRTTPEKEADPPVLASGVVDLVNDLVPLDKMNPLAGFYVANWTVPSNAAVGRYAIEWTYVLTNPQSQTMTVSNSEDPPSGVTRKTFEVVAAPSVAGTVPLYSLLTDARDVLGGCAGVTDVRLQKLITLASSMVERITGRTFGARYQVLRRGGNSSRLLSLGPPICSVSSVGIDTEPTQRGDLVVELDLLRIYNRHLTQGLLDPDDREAPKLEFVHSDDLYGIRFVPFRGISLRSLAWPIGVQNIHVRGFFGYTDPDGSPWGETPELIQHVTRLICARELPKLGSDEREDVQWRWRVTSEKTRETQIQMADPRKWGEWFGDPEIDSILASFVRPPHLGSA